MEVRFCSGLYLSAGRHSDVTPAIITTPDFLVWSISGLYSYGGSGQCGAVQAMYDLKQLHSHHSLNIIMYLLFLF